MYHPPLPRHVIKQDPATGPSHHWLKWFVLRIKTPYNQGRPWEDKGCLTLHTPLFTSLLCRLQVHKRRDTCLHFGGGLLDFQSCGIHERSKAWRDVEEEEMRNLQHSLEERCHNYMGRVGSVDVLFDCNIRVFSKNVFNLKGLFVSFFFLRQQHISVCRLILPAVCLFIFKSRIGLRIKWHVNGWVRGVFFFFFFFGWFICLFVSL